MAATRRGGSSAIRANRTIILQTTGQMTPSNASNTYNWCQPFCAPRYSYPCVAENELNATGDSVMIYLSQYISCYEGCYVCSQRRRQVSALQFATKKHRRLAAVIDITAIRLLMLQRMDDQCRADQEKPNKQRRDVKERRRADEKQRRIASEERALKMFLELHH